MMHNVLIQMKRCPSLLVMMIASWKVLGSELIRISFLCFSIDASVVLIKGRGNSKKFYGISLPNVRNEEQSS